MKSFFVVLAAAFSLISAQTSYPPPGYCTSATDGGLFNEFGNYIPYAVYEWVRISDLAKPWVAPGPNQTDCVSLLTDWIRASVAFNDYMVGGNKTKGTVAFAGAQPFVLDTFSKLTSCFIDPTVGRWFGNMSIDFGNALASGSDVAQPFLVCVHQPFYAVVSTGHWDEIAHNC